MNDRERELIRLVVDGDIRKAQAQAKIILNETTTAKDKQFKEYQLRRLENRGPELITLPYNLQHLLVAQDVSNFPENRFLLRPEESAIVDKLLSTRKAALRLQELGIQYTSSLLLTGEPGTGKTELARYIAHVANLPFVYVKFSGLVESYLGKTQTNIGRVFDYARNAPCVLCIDEIDAIGTSRGGSDDVAEMSRVVIALMQELDNIKNDVVVIGTTNRPDKLDKALFRRFTLVHEVKALDEADVEVLADKFFASVEYPLIVEEREEFFSQFDSAAPAIKVIAVCTSRIIDKVVAEEAATVI